MSRNKPPTPPPVSTAIDYHRFARNALRAVVRDALAQVAERGLPGDHHFYIIFDTRHPGVLMPSFLHAAHPEQMSIVLQHRFSDLRVGETEFSVLLSFNNQPHRLTVPYAAILDFTDPGAPFRLTFPRENKQTGEATAAKQSDKKEKKRKGDLVKVEEDGDSQVLHVNFPRHRSAPKDDTKEDKET